MVSASFLASLMILLDRFSQDSSFVRESLCLDNESQYPSRTASTTNRASINIPLYNKVSTSLLFYKHKSICAEWIQSGGFERRKANKTVAGDEFKKPPPMPC